MRFLELKRGIYYAFIHEYEFRRWTRPVASVSIALVTATANSWHTSSCDFITWNDGTRNWFVLASPSALQSLNLASQDSGNLPFEPLDKSFRSARYVGPSPDWAART